MLARVLAIALCLCLSVCLSVTSRSSVEMAGRIRLVLSMGAFFDFFDLRPSTLCVVRKFGYLQK